MYSIYIGLCVIIIGIATAVAGLVIGEYWYNNMVTKKKDRY